MSVPVFEQVTAGLYRLSTLAESGLEAYWAGYLASPGSDLGASASLAQTWADLGGAYLFLGSAPADPASFVSDLRALWPRGVRRPPRQPQPVPGAHRARSGAGRCAGPAGRA